MYKSTAENSPHQKHQKQSLQLQEVHEPPDHEWDFLKKKKLYYLININMLILDYSV